MSITAKRFATGFVVGVVAAAFLNVLPFLQTRGAYNMDLFEVIGFPFIIRRLGGFAGIHEFHTTALIADIALGLAVALFLGFGCARVRHAVNKPSTQRFAVSAVLMSLGWLAFPWMDAASFPFFFAAWLIIASREQLQRVVRQRELLWMACILVAFIAIVVAERIFVPEFGDRALERFFRRPVIIVPLWLLCLWLGYRDWRRVHNVA